MSKRLSYNPNLRVSFENSFEGLEVLPFQNGWVVEYMQSIHSTLCKAINQYPRTYAVRFELMFPQDVEVKHDDAVITRFIASLKAKLCHNMKTRADDGRRVHPCTLRYVWCKEKNSSLNYHYHMLIFFNRDTYKWLGQVDLNNDSLLSTRIAKAWNSALGLGPHWQKHSVHYPRSNEYHIDTNSECYIPSINDLFRRASYLAKVDTKIYANSPGNEFELDTPSRSFGCSQR